MMHTMRLLIVILFIFSCVAASAATLTGRAVRITQTHANQNMTKFEHLEPPVCHGYLPQKVRESTRFNRLSGLEIRSLSYQSPARVAPLA